MKVENQAKLKEKEPETNASGSMWRRERDSNPRVLLAQTDFEL